MAVVTLRDYEVGEPPVQVQVPQDWERQEVDGAVLAVVAPDTGPDFRPNLVVTQVAADDLSLALAAEELQRTLSGLPEVAEVGSGERVVDEKPGYAAEVTFRAPNGQVLVQTHWVTSLAGSSGRDVLVHLTGTCAASTAERDLPVLRHALASTRLPYRPDEDH